MLSNKPLDRFRKISEIDRQRIVELNQESFDQLLTFVDIVPDNAFDLGFIQSNFAKDRDAINCYMIPIDTNTNYIVSDRP